MTELIELLNLREAAGELRLSIHTVRAWVSQKRIPFVRLGRRILIRRQDLEEIVNENLVKPKERKA